MGNTSSMIYVLIGNYYRAHRNIAEMTFFIFFKDIFELNLMERSNLKLGVIVKFQSNSIFL